MIFAFANAVAVAMYVVGFAETVVDLLKVIKSFSFLQPSKIIWFILPFQGTRGYHYGKMREEIDLFCRMWKLDLVEGALGLASELAQNPGSHVYHLRDSGPVPLVTRTLFLKSIIGANNTVLCVS